LFKPEADSIHKFTYFPVTRKHFLIFAFVLATVITSLSLCQYQSLLVSAVIDIVDDVDDAVGVDDAAIVASCHVSFDSFDSLDSLLFISLCC
jgi:hypothetical protein